ncbi:hypothetical protein RRF57_002050 [Xylaria bambusicola]|uniref:Altered inheritance of mitochondria protein 21 n=1 Tax=Xylaria bambusicola TaxID=326684 RepID=A0AAN7U6D2_9PEZI
MRAATMSSTPAVPPRPTRSQEKTNGTAPTIPVRPTKRFNRSVSPNPDRFAPSPLNEGTFGTKPKRHSQGFLGEELERSTSVDLPGVGQEGQEYAVALEELRASSPEQTRIVGEDLKLHAPKPTVPAASAKQRVAAVTRTDSERAAAFGIGRPNSEEPLHSGARSLKKKASTISQLSHHSELHTDDEHGIPEIGQRVPMLSYAGDVQAPSPAPPRASSVDSTKSGRHHTRRASSRSGFHDLPPGSYGLHGHGVESTDKLEKAYYEKHPEKYQKEHYHPLHNRVHDYSMSSENLNKIVRDTASRGAGFGTTGYTGTPSEQVGFQASDEYTSRIASPQPAESAKSLLKNTTSGSTDEKGNVIHVDEDNQYEAYAKYGNEESAEGHGAHDNAWPILAADEVAKDPSAYELQPAIPPNRRGSDDARSRPTSRPASVYSPPPPEVRSTPLEDVEDRDIWEDAPNSVHSTAEVSTPEPADTRPKSHTTSVDLSTRDAETPAQAFARRQEELAEKEAVTPDSFLNRTQRPKSWVEHQPHIAQEIPSRPNTSNRFPSRDVWEDTPDSLQFTTTVSTPQSAVNLGDEEAKSEEPANRPVVPVRPPKKQSSGDDASKPTIPDRPKPRVPIRPVKSVADAKESEGGVKQKPVVPARPVGGKIAALQAGFMSDLNNRLRLGPQAPPPKKDAPPPEEVAEEKEKAPLADARKGRARGPQRRAPTKSQSLASGVDKSVPPPVSNGHPILSFSMTRTLWSIDEEGTVMVDDFGPEKAGKPEVSVKEIEPGVEEAKPVEFPPEQLKTEGAEAVETNTEEVSEQKEPGKTVEGLETKTDDKPGDSQETVEEEKSLVTNTAGEPILTETFEKKKDSDEVKEVEDVKDGEVS